MNDKYKIVTVAFNAIYAVREESYSKEEAEELCQQLIDKTNYAGCGGFMEYYVIKDDEDVDKTGIVDKIKGMLKGE